MLTPVYTRQFEKDVRRMQRRGKNIEKMKIVIPPPGESPQVPQKVRYGTSDGGGGRW